MKVALVLSQRIRQLKKTRFKRKNAVLQPSQRRMRRLKLRLYQRRRKRSRLRLSQRRRKRSRLSLKKYTSIHTHRSRRAI